eukprot:ANDGO_03425.mRNA.1 hypothetical protein
MQREFRKRFLSHYQISESDLVADDLCFRQIAEYQTVLDVIQVPALLAVGPKVKSFNKAVTDLCPYNAEEFNGARCPMTWDLIAPESILQLMELCLGAFCTPGKQVLSAVVSLRGKNNQQQCASVAVHIFHNSVGFPIGTFTIVTPLDPLPKKAK